MKGIWVVGFWVGICLFCGVGYAQEGVVADVIRLEDPADIQDANTLNQAVDVMSQKVTACVENQEAPPDACFCRYADQLAQVKTIFDEVITKHPDWQGKVIFWWKDDTQSYSYNLAMDGLRQTFEVPCP